MAEVGEEEEKMAKIGSYGGMVRIVSTTIDDSSMEEEEEEEGAAAAAEEMMLLWGIQQPTLSKPNAFVSQSSLHLPLDACGRSLSILQSPSSLTGRDTPEALFGHEDQEEERECNTPSMLEVYMCCIDYIVNHGTPGVTGAVLWDSGVVLGKFLEHAVESGMMVLRGKKVVELGSGCGLVGCIAALLGAEVTLTDLPDRLRLLKKNIETNLYGDVRGSAAVSELIWGEEPDPELIDPSPDYDVIYSEGAVVDLLATLLQLSGIQTTIILAGELRNDAILQYFLESASKDFTIGRVDQTQWHPDYCSPRVVVYVLVKKNQRK